jgi:thiamine pyrophosphokinase
MDDLRFLRRQIDRHNPAALVCADGGARYLHALNATPDMIVGDLDSLEPPLLETYTQRGVEIRRHPPAKDDTDAALALTAACEMAPEAVWIFGGLGGRIDHALTNLSLLLTGEARGIPVKFLDRWCEVYLAGPRGSVRGRPGQTVSLLPFFGEAQGVTLADSNIPDGGQSDHGPAHRGQQPPDGEAGAHLHCVGPPCRHHTGGKTFFPTKGFL